MSTEGPLHARAGETLSRAVAGRTESQRVVEAWLEGKQKQALDLNWRGGGESRIGGGGSCRHETKTETEVDVFLRCVRCFRGDVRLNETDPTEQ